MNLYKGMGDSPAGYWHHNIEESVHEVQKGYEPASISPIAIIIRGRIFSEEAQGFISPDGTTAYVDSHIMEDLY